MLKKHLLNAEKFVVLEKYLFRAGKTPSLSASAAAITKSDTGTSPNLTKYCLQTKPIVCSISVYDYNARRLACLSVSVRATGTRSIFCLDRFQAAKNLFRTTDGRICNQRVQDCHYCHDERSNGAKKIKKTARKANLALLGCACHPCAASQVACALQPTDMW